jgi:hypothetical protein
MEESLATNPKSQLSFMKGESCDLSPLTLSLTHRSQISCPGALFQNILAASGASLRSGVWRGSASVPSIVTVRKSS